MFGNQLYSVIAYFITLNLIYNILTRNSVYIIILPIAMGKIM